MTFLAGPQVSDRCPLGYLFVQYIWVKKAGNSKFQELIKTSCIYVLNYIVGKSFISIYPNNIGADHLDAATQSHQHLCCVLAR